MTYYTTNKLILDKMKKQQLQQIIREEIKNTLNEDHYGKLVASLIAEYQNTPGREGLVVSKFLTLEKVLKQLKRLKASDPNATDELKTIDMVLKTFDEIRNI